MTPGRGARPVMFAAAQAAQKTTDPGQCRGFSFAAAQAAQKSEMILLTNQERFAAAQENTGIQHQLQPNVRCRTGSSEKFQH